jgi:Flp pilus assembly protein CpaB
VTRRSIILVACGVLTVLVGVAVALIGGSDRNNSASASTAPVLVAKEPIAEGAEGTDVTADGLVTVEQVPTSERQLGALTDPSQLDGRTFDAAVASGSQVLTNDLVPQATNATAGPVDVPKGTEAVAVEVPFVPGGAGFAAPGDRVNVFALLDDAGPALTGDPAAAGAGPATVSVLTDVEVLQVSTASGSGSTGTSTSSGSSSTTPKQVTYLLAVPVDRVEALVQAAGFHRLWVSLPADGAVARPGGVAGDGQLVEAGR